MPSFLSFPSGALPHLFVSSHLSEPPPLTSKQSGHPEEDMQPTPGFSVAHSLHPATQREVDCGNIIVDPRAYGTIPANSLATKCPLCKQTLVTKDHQLSFRKNHALKGFAISSPDSVAKGQRKRQPLCLECVKRHLGPVTQCANKLTISVARTNRDSVVSTEVWFQRKTLGEAWSQLKDLSGEEIGDMREGAEEGRLAFSGNRSSTAAQAAVNRGRKVGETARSNAQVKGQLHTENGEASAAKGGRTIVDQAMMYLDGLRSGECAMYSVGELGSASTVYLASTWNHNAAGLKPLGRPSKVHALLETVNWDTMGNVSCTCDCGRRYTQAPCVHKLALQALESPRLASAISLQRGPKVVEIPCDRIGERVFGVYWNAGSPSPQRTMVHHGEGAQMGWYCEGRKSGCSKTADCSHIQGVKRAMSRPSGVDKLSKSSFSEGQLELAKTALKAGLVDSRAGSVTAHSRPGTADSDVDGYIAELVVGSHERAACEGSSCFCKQHPRVFGGAGIDVEPCAARCCTSAQTNGKRARSEQGESSGVVERANARSGKRRSKTFWAAKGTEPEEPNAATGTTGEAVSDAAEDLGRGPKSALQVEDRDALSIPVCNVCVCPSNVCTHGASRGAATVLPMEAEGVQLEVPKLVRPTDSWQVHDPEVSLLRRPIRVSELTARDFEELSIAGSLSAPCPRAPPPCRTRWLGLWQSAHVYDLYWSQEVKLRIYCCACPEKHTVHYNGEALRLYAWTRRVVVTQAACQMLLRTVQKSGAAFSSLVAAGNAVRRQYNPDATFLSEECWRKASLDFFKLCGRQIMECCSLCGPHPQVLLCDGIAGLACADGTRQKGGLAGTDAALLRPFTAPSRDSNGFNVRKVMESGSNYLAVSLAGGGLKRRLLHQPEVRTLVARFSGHHAVDPELGKTPSAQEYEELLVALDRDDVQVVTNFVQDPDDVDADPVLLHWRRWVAGDQVGQIRSKNKAMCELLEGIEREAMQDEHRWPPRCPHRWAELLYTLGAPFSVSDDSNLIQHGKALGVVRKLLLGEAANDDDRAVLSEHSPILRRLLDHYGDRFPPFFHPALHHLYRLTLFARGAVGLGVGRAGWALSAIEGLDVCVWLEREPKPLSVEQQQAFDFWAARANALLPGVESLSPPAPHEYALLPPERILLNERLGLEADGSEPGPLPPDHPYCHEQRGLGCYVLPGWEQKRPLPQYEPFEDDLGRSCERNEEHRCRSGLTVGEFDAKVALESGIKKKKCLQRHTKGGFVFTCPHCVIYGFHVMLRGESPRDAFTVLYT
ncbi:hypothetical protein KFL_000490380 [Klebsormidium nitens]|uniref:SWIM-type domain-containing protein n=1 Tax=Klebsormidium nitens TaxID=105231 RepID=A0A0U9HTT7_KLENI|nr:hypothetical protein KFL_000490380 [Klebsormidium nitens]|eukprot:GAQ80248.1 hypothetical protein KFL_000490380 [Klebsormidium nitens]